MGATVQGQQIVQVARFSTDDYGSRDQYDAWRDDHPASPSRFMESRPIGHFYAHSDWFALGGRAIYHTDIAEQDWWRGPEHLHDDADSFAVNVRFSGAAVGTVDGEDFTAASGAVLIADLSRPQAHRSDPCRCMGFLLSREEMARLMPAFSPQGVTIAPERTLLLRNHTQRIHARAIAGTLTEAEGARSETMMLHLLEVAVTEQRGERASRAAMFAVAKERVLQEIEDNLGSARLTVARLCRRSGLSRSALYRLFEEEDGVQNWIRRRRLAAVASTLSEPDNDETIGALADRWGFCDAAYLGRVFREAYGMTPGEFRASALAR